ncbi:MAG: type II toxin-antitoxin system prevent-host-death family antitoxin [Acidobacteria bacterium]|nr:type II toxin-antitoxin system prevent-host-death family antitoxin [Acidobacteriota bacterium]
MTMMIVNIYEAKAKLSEFLDLAARGERVLICKRNRPIAELRAVESARTEPRPIGLARGRMVVPDSFFQPLPDEMLDAFDGIEPRAGLLHVADASPSATYGGRSARKASKAGKTRNATKTTKARTS